MKTQINRGMALARWNDGSTTVTLSRFVHEDRRISHKSLTIYKVNTMLRLERIDRILARYVGRGVRVSADERLMMVSQEWENVFLCKDEVIDRNEFDSVADMLDEYFPLYIEAGV